MKHFKDKTSLIAFALGYAMGRLERDLERMTENEPEFFDDEERQRVQNMLADFREVMVRYDA